MSLRSAEARFQKTLVVNAAVSGSTGAVMFAFASPIDGVLGSEAPTLVRTIRGGLVVFAAAVFAIGRSDGRRLVAGARWILLADIAWVLASFGVALTGWLSAVGVALGVVVAVVVGAFAVGEASGLRELGGRVGWGADRLRPSMTGPRRPARHAPERPRAGTAVRAAGMAGDLR